MDEYRIVKRTYIHYDQYTPERKIVLFWGLLVIWQVSYEDQDVVSFRSLQECKNWIKRARTQDEIIEYKEEV